MLKKKEKAKSKVKSKPSSKLAKAKSKPKAKSAKKPTAAKLVNKKVVKKPSNSTTTITSKKAKIPTSKLVTKTGKVLKPKNVKPKVAHKPSSTDVSSSIRPAKKRRMARGSSSIPIDYQRIVASNAGIVHYGRHIRTRRSVMIEDSRLNATFEPMMHSIQIISPVEDFDDKELNAWEKLMQLEGRAEMTDLFDDQRRIGNNLTKSTNIIDALIFDSQSKDVGSYCFSMIHLVAASILFSAITVILSMIFYMICLYSQSKNQVQQSINEKLSYLS